MLALALLDQIFVLHILVTRLAVEPSPASSQNERQRGGTEDHLLASSADCVMKNPTELAGILDMCGLMQILGSPPASSDLTSIASRSNLSLMKQSSEA